MNNVFVLPHIKKEAFKRTISLCLAALLCVSMIITGTLTYFMSSNATNVFAGSAQLTVELVKYEMDVNGEETTTPVPGAIFKLFAVSRDENDNNKEELTPITLTDEQRITDADGKIKIDHLPNGDYMWREEQLPDNYTHVTDENGKITDYYFTVSKDESNPNLDTTGDIPVIRVTAYNQRLSGSLEVTKKVEGINTDRTFLFYLTLDGTAPEGATYTVAGGETQTLGTNGAFELRGGQTATFSNLPAGAHYYVTESVPTSYAVTSVNCEGHITAITTEQGADGNNITNGEPNKASVVNQYNPGSSGSLVVKKDIEGNAASVEDVFVFTVKFAGGSDTDTYEYYYAHDPGNKRSLTNGGEIELTGEQSVVFPDLAVGEKYTVTEKGLKAAQGNAITPPTVETAAAPPVDETGEPTAASDSNPAPTSNEESSDSSTPATDESTEPEKAAESQPVLAAPRAVSDYVAEETTIEGEIIKEGSVAAFVNVKNDTPYDIGTLLISKEVAGVEGDTTKFTFHIQFGNDTTDKTEYSYYKDGNIMNLYTIANNSTMELAHGDVVTFYDIKVGTTYLITEDAVEGYYQGIISQSGTIANDSASAIFVNEKQPERNDSHLEVTKIVENAPETDKEKAFQFFITFNDKVDTGYTYTVRTSDDNYIMDGENAKVFTQADDGSFTLQNGQTAVFDVPEGVLAKVREAEHSPDYLITKSEGSLITVDGDATTTVSYTNTYQEKQTIDISGTKVWDMTAAPEGTEPPESVTLILNQNGAKYSIKDVYAADDWKFTFKDLPKTDSDTGEAYEYTIDEVAINGYKTAIDGTTVTNTYIPGVTSNPIDIVKGLIGSPSTSESFEFVLEAADSTYPMPDGAEGTKKTIVITGKGSGTFGSIYFTEAGTYTYTVRETDKGTENYTYDAAVYTITYTVSEQNGQLTAERTIKKDGVDAIEIRFTNKYAIPEATLIDVSVSKRWVDNNDDAGKRPESITVNLYHMENGTKVVDDTVQLTEANGWRQTWVQIEEKDYAIEEVRVNNYTSVLSGSLADGFVITNTYTPGTPGNETVTIGGTKTWVDNNNAAGKRPSAITVYILRNGQRIKELTVTASDGWSWSATLPKYDEKANPISYTVEEAPVLGYSAFIEGYNIKNTYTPDGTPDKPVDPDKPPQTGDESNLMLWFWLVIVSLVGLRITLFWRTKSTEIEESHGGKRR